MNKKIHILFLAAAFAVFHAGARPALQPFPRECTWGEGVVKAAGKPVVRDDVRQCEIGASELPFAGSSRVYAGEELADGIYLAVRGTKLAEKLTKAFSIDLPQKRQGYALVAEKGRIAVVGYDAIGALYGAMTLRQLMAEGGTVPAVRISDWPDYAVRGQMKVWGGLNRYGEISTRKAQTLDVAAVKAGLDEMARHKLNIISSLHSSFVFPKDPAILAQYREIFAYARERGIRGNFVIPQAVFTRQFRPGKEYLDEKGKWPCNEHHTAYSDYWYCWSMDEETANAARWWAGYLRNLGATDACVVIHPRDSCGKTGRDPEEFSRRCAKCRARYTDDERWKATADQLNIFTRILKAELPELDVGSCVQPYTIEIMKRLKEDASWKRDTVEFWSKVHQSLEDPRFYLGGWACRREFREEFSRLAPNRPYRFGDIFAANAGVFMTSARRYGTMFDGGDDDRVMVTATINDGQWESMLLAAEYLWNTKAAGYEDFDGKIWYDPLTDHTGPEVVMNTHLPAICRTFWGEKIAPAMIEFLSCGVMPQFLANPEQSLYWWNRVRKNAMYDPTGGSMGSTGNKVELQPIAYDEKLLNGQVAAAEKALKALEKARRYMDEMPVGKHIYFSFNLHRAPYWLATARVRASIFTAKKALEAGAADGGLPYITAALETAKRDYAAADANAKALRKKGFYDNIRFMPYGLSRAEAMNALQRAERAAMAGRKADAEVAADRRRNCIAEAGVREGRNVDFPVKPTEKCEVWSGERIIDKPTVVAGKNLYVMPGTKVMFRGKGSLSVRFGSLYASNAEFTADGVLLGDFRIHIKRASCWFDNCRFTGMKSAEHVRWGTGFMRVQNSANKRKPFFAKHCTFTDCSAVSFEFGAKSEISNCLFENGERGVCALLSLDTLVENCVFRNLSSLGVELRQADATDVVGNMFENCPHGTLFSLSRDCRLIGNSYDRCQPYRTAMEGKNKTMTKPLVINE